MWVEAADVEDAVEVVEQRRCSVANFELRAKTFSSGDDPRAVGSSGRFLALSAPYCPHSGNQYLQSFSAGASRPARATALNINMGLAAGHAHLKISSTTASLCLQLTGQSIV